MMIRLLRLFPAPLASLIGFLAASAVSPSASAAVSYSITDLGAFSPTAINNNGDMVGYGATGSHAALRYNNGTIVDLGTLAAPYTSQSYPLALNDNDQIVGYSAATNGATQAFLFGNGIISPLGDANVHVLRATSINTAGQIVAVDTSENAVLLSNTAAPIVIAAANNSYSYATGINTAGQVVGGAQFQGVQTLPFVYAGGTLSALTSLPAPYSSFQANAINDNGEIIGDATGPMNSPPDAWFANRAFLYSGGTTSDLGTLGGSVASPLAINDNGLIVGFSTISGDTSVAAFAYRDGTMTNLDLAIPADSGWHLMEATGVDNSNEIIGYGLSPTGSIDGYLLTPIPEPASAALMAMTCLPLLFLRRRAIALTGVHNRLAVGPTDIGLDVEMQ